MQMAWIRKILMLSMSIFCFYTGGYSQNTKLPNIEWDKDHPLTWKDFPFIKLRSGKKEIALTSVKHSVVGKMVNGSPDFEVHVYFIAKDSWTTDTASMSLLAHEQLHFDIGELFRRKIVQKVKRLRDSGEKQKAIYRYAIKKLLSDFRNFSNEYDRQTKHGVLETEQKRWKNKVWEALNRLH